jgi:hypothetical protein
MYTRTLWAAALVLGGPVLALDLHHARIATAPNLSPPEKKAVAMLVDEVEKRTGLTWPLSGAAEGGPVITIHHASGARPPEGFHLTVRNGTIDIQGNDERGVLFGIGRFLRELRWDRGQVEIADSIDLTSSPKYPLRGHQIGYRPKVNTYDAWTPAVFEQYVRDLAVFGTNAIELIPPRSDDDDQSPHFHLPKMEMMVEMSRIISEYGLQVWIWYPAMDPDYSDPHTVESALKEWGEVFQRLPRVDAVFVPGGDPGHSRPKVLMDFLGKEAGVLRKYHPKAQMWVSPQNFNGAWLDEFVDIVKTEPAWLDGVSYGPWTRISLPELRSRVPARYPVRNYPDITHTIHAEYPVPDWDVAYAVTEARESINPRPMDYAAAFHATSPSSIGFISYSEGVNDDVNKFVWSGLGWDPDRDVVQTLREFGRYFISPKFEDGIAQGLLALERDWRGPLLANSGVDDTLRQYQAMERAATPQMLRNWRFQQELYRAYYDGYVRQRFTYETGLEQQALARLSEASRIGSSLALDDADRILCSALDKPVAQNLRARVFELGEALYQSIGMQLSVDKYKAIAVSRGANLDTIDFPLNNRVWLENRFAEIRKMGNEADRLAGISAILNRTNPGPGGFYDDLGSASMQPHLVQVGPGFDKDPGAFRSTRSGYQAFSGGLIGRSSLDAIRPDGPARFLQSPMAWWTYSETRYETPLTMRYDHLDPKAQYKVRVVFVGGGNGAKVRVTANDLVVDAAFARPGSMQPVEFDIPAEAVKNGALTLRWTLEPGQGGFSAEVAIAEVFLIRK